MAKKVMDINYSVVTKKGNTYYRAKRLDADGKWIDVYGKSPEDLNEKLILAEKKNK